MRHRQLSGRLGADDACLASARPVRPDHHCGLSAVLLGGRPRTVSHALFRGTSRRQLADGASSVFDKGTGQAEKAGEALVGELYRQIGQQKVELDFLARRLGR